MSADAQEASPPPPKPAIKMLFLPPPMEGTISMGIYDSTGKLVRTLHREAEVDSSAFVKDINGLITFWDGKDDAGNVMPAGKYSAHGIMVGDLKVEGEAFLCNDWAEEGTPRIRRITSLGSFEGSNPTVTFGVELGDGKIAQAQCSASGTLTLLSGTDSAEIKLPKPDLSKITKADPKETTLDSAQGRDGSIWVVDRAADGGIEVKQFAQNGEFLRRLSIDANQPLPKQIAVSKTTDAICLLEENAQSQRLRWLELSTAAAGEPNVSNWTEVLSKTITFNDRFEQVQPILKMPSGKPVVPQTKASVSLVPNPMLNEKVTSQEISVGFDAGGSFLTSGDGLILKRITDTPLLKWAILAQDPESKALVVFQSDGAVVEEYRISAIANMMTFDYGEFSFTPAK